MRWLAVPVVLLCAAAAAVWLAWPPTSGDGADPAVVWPDPNSASTATARVPPRTWTARPPPPWAKVDREQIEAAARHRAPVAFENHLGMRFVLIPAGTFRMGSPTSEAGRRADETAHEVVLSRPFYMQTTEVTNAQLRRCEVRCVGRDHHSGAFRGRSLNGDEQPAVQVSWDAASAFADWVGEEDRGRHYRLPTEAEWEHACRARSATPYWWGDSTHDGWRAANANDPRTRTWLDLTWSAWAQFDGHLLAAPVASYRANRWGLHDMAGNVWEWCADWYAPLGTGRRIDPRGPRDGSRRVLRGGSWLFDPTLARSAARLRDRPNARSMHVGFRLVSPLPEGSE